ncbi:TRAP transporter small permease [Leeia sp. TBRC 13508]|uniref:TRAP transporter small permease protein n=1 Tax=Leeia speluncae TaxID=2884804 RepID=A0ABS8D340_9NEIS|nr:TRAP transporter small permease [Leeia speluncae]MCB6182610.1 TRAP transporter small permease [Leeia speluncae]
MKWLDKLEETFIAFLMAGATAIIFLAVLQRYLSGVAFMGIQDFFIAINVSWAQELCIIMFVWMAKFGAAYGVRTGIHVGVDVLINRLSDKNRKKFILIGLGAGALFTGIIATMGGELVMHVQESGSTTEVLEWPQWIVYLAIPLGSSLMCFRFLQVLVSFARTGELPKHDHGHVDGMEDILDEANLVPQDMKHGKGDK